MSKFKPALVLAVIAAIVSALVIITYNITYVDTSDILTKKQTAAVIAVYGGAEEDYSVLPAEEWQPAFEACSADLSRVTKVIEKNDGSLAFEVRVKGYKEGYTLLVGVKDGAVAGVAAVSTGEETPNLGTKTAEQSYLDNFKGMSGAVTIVTAAPENEGEIQAVTGATYSSKGVAKAVNIALAAYDCLTGTGAGGDA